MSAYKNLSKLFGIALAALCVALVYGTHGEVYFRTSSCLWVRFRINKF